ncbi:MAG: LicD family protein [Ruminococcus sp.]|nr:LicD family protein [Ruminococcus sp.]
MTNVQSKLLSLVDEIVEICKKEKLNYIVSDVTAAYITDHKSFNEDQCLFNIMMPLPDIIKLEKYVNKNLSETRIIEYWKNNPDLYMLKFRYVDKTTLFFDGGVAEKRKYNGIFVNILPTREFEPANDVRGIERYIQIQNYGQKSLVPALIICKLLSRITHINIFKSLVMRRVKLDNANYIHYGLLKSGKMTKEKMIDYVITENLKANKPFRSARFLPEELVNENEEIKENCLAFMNDKSNVIKLPIDLYTNVKEVEFEGRKYNVYAEQEKYLETMYGADWYAISREDIPGSTRSTVICDTEIPYEEYMEYIKDDEVTLTDIRERKLEYNIWMGKVHNPAVNKTWRTFYRARRSVDRIDIWYKLRNKRDKLAEAYEAKDIAKLKKILKPYINATERYRVDKIGFYIDDELFKYATLVWESENRPGKTDSEGNMLTYAQYIYSLVPDIYKTETPDEYFAKRGTQIIDN